MQNFGTGFTIAIVPLFTVAALVAFAIAPVLATIAIVVVTSRAMGYGLSGPAMRDALDRGRSSQQYHARNFIDTLVQRGGNAAAGWILRGSDQRWARPVQFLQFSRCRSPLIGFGFSRSGQTTRKARRRTRRGQTNRLALIVRWIWDATSEYIAFPTRLKPARFRP